MITMFPLILFIVLCIAAAASSSHVDTEDGSEIAISKPLHGRLHGHTISHPISNTTLAHHKHKQVHYHDVKNFIPPKYEFVDVGALAIASFEDDTSFYSYLQYAYDAIFINHKLSLPGVLASSVIHKKVYVSITTMDSRIDYVHNVIIDLLEGKYRPYLFIYIRNTIYTG